ncbi:hypothetical protein [Nostoc sp.]|uniref:hypothetical protein n=1 Tax=Nostoc sp. TaxID=1180 RepID=UPI002FFC08CD
MEILFVLGMLIQFAVLAIRIVRLFRRQPEESDTQRVNKIRGRVSQSYRSDPNNRKLQQDLIAMLRGDIATAKRLLRYERQRNPGNSDNWYLEKVIGDLERDRR